MRFSGLIIIFYILDKIYMYTLPTKATWLLFTYMNEVVCHQGG
jgi:hypothetical protein